jgi:hypothetical protein
MPVQFFPCLYKCSRVFPCVCGCIHEDPLFPIIPTVMDSTPQRMEHLLMDAWPCFPGFKVGQMFLSILPRSIPPCLIWFGLESSGREFQFKWQSRPSPQLKPFHNTPSNAECLYGSNIIIIITQCNKTTAIQNQVKQRNRKGWNDECKTHGELNHSQSNFNTPILSGTLGVFSFHSDDCLHLIYSVQFSSLSLSLSSQRKNNCPNVLVGLNIFYPLVQLCCAGCPFWRHCCCTYNLRYAGLLLAIGDDEARSARAWTISVSNASTPSSRHAAAKKTFLG